MTRARACGLRDSRGSPWRSPAAARRPRRAPTGTRSASPPHPPTTRNAGAVASRRAGRDPRARARRDAPSKARRAAQRAATSAGSATARRVSRATSTRSCGSTTPTRCRSDRRGRSRRGYTRTTTACTRRRASSRDGRRTRTSRAGSSVSSASAGRCAEVRAAALPGRSSIWSDRVRSGRCSSPAQPNTASEPRAYFSTQIVETGRWTHVAVTYDGDVVSLYVDGRLDAQYTNTGGIRATQAPLVFGNYIDPDDLTDFQGSLRVQPNTTTPRSTPSRPDRRGAVVARRARPARDGVAVSTTGWREGLPGAKREARRRSATYDRGRQKLDPPASRRTPIMSAAISPIDTSAVAPRPAWNAVLHRDARYDGRFVYAVTTTGVYCRPSCASRRPRRDHVEFFADAAAAESAGYRGVSSAGRSARRGTPPSPCGARALLDEAADGPPTLIELSRRLETTPARITRSFRRAFGMTQAVRRAATRRAPQVRAASWTPRARGRIRVRLRGREPRVRRRRANPRHDAFDVPPRRRRRAHPATPSRGAATIRCWWRSPNVVCAP